MPTPSQNKIAQIYHNVIKTVLLQDLDAAHKPIIGGTTLKLNKP